MKIITNQSLYRTSIPEDAPLYVKPEWMDIFSGNWEASIGLDKQNEPVWLWPFLKKSRYGLKKYGRLPFCPDNGPVFLNESAVKSFDPRIDRWFSITVIDDRRRLLSGDQMGAGSWKEEDRFYQYFDLQHYPQDFQAVSRAKRKRMKKSGHFELVRYHDLDETGPMFLSSFHSLGQMKMTTKDLEVWKMALDHSFDHYLFGLKDTEGNVLSAQWLVGYQDTLYGWLAVRHPQFPDAGARELLLWHILQWAREHYRIYDLGGSSIPGVRRFNLEMGAKEITYHRYTRFRPGWVGKVHG